MKKTILIGIFALAFAFSNAVKAEISLSGYTEFLAGTVEQNTLNGATEHGQDKSGGDNGTYTRITGNYSSTLDSGIDVSGVMNVSTRDCQGDKTNNCNVVDFNFLTFSGGFGSVSVGERFAAGAAMLSRLTASGPSADVIGCCNASASGASADVIGCCTAAASDSASASSSAGTSSD